MQTEFEFTLPKGYVDETGAVHRNGRMRLATALDEIEAVEHPRVQEKESFLPVVLLGRVVTQLGTLNNVTPRIIAQLFSADLAYLEDMYLRLNSAYPVRVGATCPHCNGQFEMQVAPLES